MHHILTLCVCVCVCVGVYKHVCVSMCVCSSFSSLKFIVRAHQTKTIKNSSAVAANTLNASTQKGDAGGSLNSRPA